MSRFFIDRPIFAWVLALVLMLAGSIEIFLMPKAQYPSIAAPQITITATYPGGSAETVADTVIRPILQHMNGLDGLEYISSTAQSNGSMKIDLTFDQGTDPNIAQVQVQNKLSLAESGSAAEVSQRGHECQQGVQELLADHRRWSRPITACPRADIADYIASQHAGPDQPRSPASATYTLFGSEYAMRIWLDPDKLIQIRADGHRRDERDPGAERAGSGRRAGRPARQCAGPAARRHRSSGHPHEHARGSSRIFC